MQWEFCVPSAFLQEKKLRVKAYSQTQQFPQGQALLDGGTVY